MSPEQLELQLQPARDGHARRLSVTGQVQGVGFRPFVFRLATELQLCGSVCNDPRGVVIEVRGPEPRLDEFARRVREEAPPLARVDRVEWVAGAPASEPREGFRILPSDTSRCDVGRVTVDSAVCADCLRELFDPHDRRYRHPLINCTNCGPRLSIIRDLPYDRKRTTMCDFAMCRACHGEYRDPSDRRFHAQPVCCHACGPTLRLLGPEGGEIGGDPVARAAGMLAAGRILAVKGLGGYHLAADARNQEAVRRLRRGKRRDRKPFAVMVGGLGRACSLTRLSPAARDLLVSPIASIVLAPRASGCTAIADAVAPGSDRIGVMLPYTPVHHLLFADRALQGVALVMTSANLSDDPLVTEDEEAIGLARAFDGVLLHDRPIERALDDSVVLDSSRGLVPLRRARGYVPTPLSLPIGTRSPGLCVGAELKNTVAVVRADQATLSQHIGDLAYPLAYRRCERTIDDMLRLFDVTPAWIARDKHPRYLSSRLADCLARERGVRLIEVQHHHAHMGSLMAEHGRTDTMVCLVCDGVGYGEDGTAWGCEVLVGNLTGFRRHARLRPLRLPGGDRAAKETWRCAASWLYDSGFEDRIGRAAPDPSRPRALLDMLRRDLNCPRSSGLGRLFDAAAALLGVCEFNHFEAMSGMALEALAANGQAEEGDGLVQLRAGRDAAGSPVLDLDHRPLLRRLLGGLDNDEPVDTLAWLFHSALAHGLSAACRDAANAHDVGTVGLSGGVFCNALLTDLVATRLETEGFEVLTHTAVPPNDGGLAYGQAAIAAACLQENEQEV